ncbi:hypothetical protein K0M31_020163 [Melipona bicolor]|uniref:Uncharacterized protein n=1 Tax=Melipona bicolor TaxID=60889 RepID=A0AA40G113_9HYME|nr:hypothetical protein K0M31_020163 [Melipona bicolor]
MELETRFVIATIAVENFRFCGSKRKKEEKREKNRPARQKRLSSFFSPFRTICLACFRPAARLILSFAASSRRDPDFEGTRRKEIRRRRGRAQIALETANDQATNNDGFDETEVFRCTFQVAFVNVGTDDNDAKSRTGSLRAHCARLRGLNSISIRYSVVKFSPPLLLSSLLFIGRFAFQFR